jgi:hypothetical protein
MARWLIGAGIIHESNSCVVGQFDSIPEHVAQRLARQYIIQRLLKEIGSCLNEFVPHIHVFKTGVDNAVIGHQSSVSIL